MNDSLFTELNPKFSSKETCYNQVFHRGKFRYCSEIIGADIGMRYCDDESSNLQMLFSPVPKTYIKNARIGGDIKYNSLCFVVTTCQAIMVYQNVLFCYFMHCSFNKFE